MIDLYTFATPNGRKASVMLEEIDVAYETHVVDLRNDEQHSPEFLAKNPNGKIPAIVDDEAVGGPMAVFESGAILIYLAEKTGKFLARSGPERYAALEWVMFQMSGVGPALGQFNHFAHSAPEKVPYAISRFSKEALRVLDVLDHRLAGREYLAGAYSIADICTYPWIVTALERLPGAPDRANVRAWVERVGARPAVKKGMSIP